MSRAIKMDGSGGGSGSDDLTAAKAQVLENHTAITKDSDDEPGTGTMRHLSNRATITHETTNGTKVLVGDAAFMATNSDGVQRAEIRYNGSDGYVTPNTLFAIPAGTMATAGGLTTSKLLAGQSAFGISGTATNDATATAAQLLAGYTAWKNGAKITGTIPSLGSQTLYPGTTAKTLYSTGSYMTGNVTVPAVSIAAAHIKKGQVITFPDGSKVTGTWEGWVATSGDLYNGGTWGRATGFTAIPYEIAREGLGWQSTQPATLTNEKGMVTLKGGYWNAVRTNNLIDLTGFTTLNVTMTSTKTGANQSRISTSVAAPQAASNYYSDKDRTISITSGFGTTTERTFTLDISGLSGSRYISFGHYCGNDGLTGVTGSGTYYSYIHRVWLS